MKTMEEILTHTAKLARLRLPEAECESIKSDFEKILEYIDEIHTLDLEGAEEMAGVCDAENVLRRDETGKSLTQKEALFNAPEEDGRFFIVPKSV